MLTRLRKELAEIARQKHQQFGELAKVTRRCYQKYEALFPNYSENWNGSRCVFNFGIPGLSPISLEKEHGSREFIPRAYARLAIEGIEDVLNYIETQAPEEQDKENDHESVAAEQEAAEPLPEPKLSDPDR